MRVVINMKGDFRRQLDIMVHVQDELVERYNEVFVAVDEYFYENASYIFINNNTYIPDTVDWVDPEFDDRPQDDFRGAQAVLDWRRLQNILRK